MSLASTALGRLYRRHIPDFVRYPLGRARRGLLDRWIRLRTPAPALPPRELLQRVQMTPWIWEYLRVGQVSAEALVRALTTASTSPSPKEGLPESRGPERLELGRAHPVLDFGCGLGRTLRHLGHTGWRLYGCDVDGRQVEWSTLAFPAAELRVNGPTPPLPWPDHQFDAAWAVSVFTHFDAEEQAAWVGELARVLRPGGLAVVTSMGPRALGGFPDLATPARRATLERDGFAFHRGGDEFNARGAFHTRAGLERMFGPAFELLSWTEGGLDGFQDLSLLRRRRPSSDAAGRQRTIDRSADRP